MNTTKKTFAFRLANRPASTGGKWVARPGLALAGCTDPLDVGNFRESYDYSGFYKGIDKGYYC